MNLINDDELDKFDVGPLTRLPSDNVPLFRSGHYDLRLFNLLLCQMDITRQLFDRDAEILESFLEVAHDLSDKSFHRRNVDNLETLGVDPAVLLPNLIHCLQDRKHGDISLACPSRRTDKQILSGLECSFV